MNILAIGAHFDDIELGCGGTIAKHISSGDLVKCIFLSDGFSSREDGVTRHKIAVDVAEYLGCEEPVFLNFPDNKLDCLPLLDIVKHVESFISEYRPNTIYTHSNNDLNIDHRLTFQAVITASRPRPNFYVENIFSFEIPSSTEWAFNSFDGSFDPNFYNNISDFLSIKIEALKKYDNEIYEFPHVRSYNSIRSLATYRGATIGVNFAEAFKIIRMLSK